MSSSRNKSTTKLPEVVDKNIISEMPIEDIIGKIHQEVMLSLSAEPTESNLVSLTALEAMAATTIECILKDDAFCRPTKEWMAALEKVEQIQDDARNLISDLKKIL